MPVPHRTDAGRAGRMSAVRPIAPKQPGETARSEGNLMSDIDVRAELAHWIENVQDADLAAELADMQAKAEAGDDAAMTDAFFQNLSFGTAGLRGVLGAGTNRMNIYTVGRATQGFADYLNANFDNPSVAIARDSRNNGELFVRTTAAIMAANGVTAYVYPRISPVPTLSWAVRDLGCSGGICMTASHNPAPYNGYKAYGPDGCQITSQAAAAISAAIAETDAFTGVKSMDFDEAVASGKVKKTPCSSATTTRCWRSR